MSSLPKLVIVALSGRALAVSARRPSAGAAGREVVVLDACGYRDTQHVAPWIDVSTQHEPELDIERITAALAGEAVGRNPQIVLGAGFEHMPERIDRLRAFGRLYANAGDVVRAWKEPLLSTELMRAVGWDVPSTQYGRPGSPQGWLRKSVGGSGGDHIRLAGDAIGQGKPREDQAIEPTNGADGHELEDKGRHYHQRKLDGRSLSAVFIGDGERAYVLGITQLRRQAVGAAVFRYAGAMTGVMLPPPVMQAIQSRLDRLVRVTGLRGLCSFDFLLDQDTIIALEINPQPPASVELYDEDLAEGLVHWHIRSFLGPIPTLAERLAMRGPMPVRAIAVLYADAPLVVPPDAAFPTWCRDLPASGRHIEANEPVLSVVVTDYSVDTVPVTAEARLRAVRQMMMPWRVSTAAAGGVAIDTAADSATHG